MSVNHRFESLPRIVPGLAALLLSGSASATPVNWLSLNLNEAQILSASGQTISNFNGIAGLTAVVTGSANLRAPTVYSAGPFVHSVDHNLHLRTRLVPASDPAYNDPVAITFSFNKYVSFTAGMHYFGDGGVQEEFRWSSNTGVFDATVSPDNVIHNDLSSLVRITSGSNNISNPASIGSTAVKDFTIALGGQNFTGPAGTTVSMDIAVSPVPEPGTYGLMLAGLATVAAMARRGRTAERDA